ncbi:MAG: hypothetical protein K2X74_19590, partial [Acetobacteraceae bacterium]|nr:hypothetical protein [Acetobacteraceae bacterium]
MSRFLTRRCGLLATGVAVLIGLAGVAAPAAAVPGRGAVPTPGDDSPDVMEASATRRLQRKATRK